MLIACALSGYRRRGLGVDKRELGEPLDGVFEADEGFVLFALAVDGDGGAGDRLSGEAVRDGAEVVVEVEPGVQAVVCARLSGLGAVDDGGADVTDRDIELLVGQPHVGRVVALGEVVPRARPRKEGHLVPFTLILPGGAASGMKNSGAP